MSWCISGEVIREIGVKCRFVPFGRMFSIGKDFSRAGSDDSELSLLGIGVRWTNQVGGKKRPHFFDRRKCAKTRSECLLLLNTKYIPLATVFLLLL